MRQFPVCRVGHHAKRGKGQITCGGSPGGNMGFRIGGEGTRFEMQGAPFGKAGHRKIDTGYVGDRRAAEGAGKPLRPNRITVIACAVLGDNRTGDKPCSRSATSAKSIIMIAFFLTMPISKMMPTIPMMERSWPHNINVQSAPTPADGSVEMMVKGWIALS